MPRPVFIAILVLLIAGTILASRFPGTTLFVAERDVIFSHALHTDLECADCHLEIMESEQAQDRNLPAMEVCGNCHDIENEATCRLCHRNPEEPGASPHPNRAIVFSHRSHLERETGCEVCHGDIAISETPRAEHMPDMSGCLECHDGEKAGRDCGLCHGDYPTLADIHPAEWRHQHGDQANFQMEWCRQCHQGANSCLECHRGDNLTGSIHNLNYRFNHGLDANSKRTDCSRCHDNRMFCNDCHERENLFPLLHSTVAWLSDHGRPARRDVENCASCHDSDDPTCARSGCHQDFDGVRGTDPRFHSPGHSLFSHYGPWHDDDGHYCFQCHTNSNHEGHGFCGYCHDDD
jgi:hypothetical protein